MSLQKISLIFYARSQLIPQVALKFTSPINGLSTSDFKLYENYLIDLSAAKLNNQKM